MCCCVGDGLKKSDGNGGSCNDGVCSAGGDGGIGGGRGGVGAGGSSGYSLFNNDFPGWLAKQKS